MCFFILESITIISNHLCSFKISDNVSEIDVHQVVTRNGVPILIDAVPSAVFEKVNDFYICELCGKVYWDGSHLERALLGPLQKVVLD